MRSIELPTPRPNCALTHTGPIDTQRLHRALSEFGSRELEMNDWELIWLETTERAQQPCTQIWLQGSRPVRQARRQLLDELQHAGFAFSADSRQSAPPRAVAPAVFQSGRTLINKHNSHTINWRHSGGPRPKLHLLYDLPEQVCPNCKTYAQPLNVVSGMPTLATENRIDLGEYVSVGCCLQNGSQDRMCRSCDHLW